MVKGLEAVAEIAADGSVQYLHNDVLGSAALITDAGGVVVHQYEYEAFGRMATDFGTNSSETNYTYTNQEFDPESGLFYYNARYYNPRLGRFISRDTVLGGDGDALSRNLYIYVKNNPLRYVDPSGMEVDDVTTDFIKKLKSNAKYMQDFGDGGDWFAAPWNISDDFILSKIKEKLPNLPDSDLNKLIEDSVVSDDLKSTPGKFKEFYNRVKPGGPWDLKSNYPQWDSGWLSPNEMLNISYKAAGNSRNYCSEAAISCQEVYDSFSKLFMSEPYGYRGLGDIKIDNYIYGNDVAGNLMYGYTGAASGFESNTLLKMAGLAQKELDLKNGKSITESWDASFYDQPRDQSAIQAGIDLWNWYGLEINSKRLGYSLRDFRNNYAK